MPNKENISQYYLASKEVKANPYVFKHLIEHGETMKKLKDKEVECGLIYPIEKGELGQHLNYAISNGKAFVGHDGVYFKPPFEDHPPPALTRPKDFLEWYDTHGGQKKYELWGKDITTKSKKHGCECVFNGGSWHLNLQECSCQGSDLGDALTKFGKMLKEETKLF